MTKLEFGPCTDRSTVSAIMRGGLVGYIVDTYLKTPTFEGFGPSGIVKDATPEGLIMVEWTQPYDWEGDRTTVPWEDIVKIVVP